MTLRVLINECPPGRRRENKLSGTMMMSTTIETIVAVSVRMSATQVPEKLECCSKLPKPQSVMAWRTPETMK